MHTISLGTSELPSMMTSLVDSTIETELEDTARAAAPSCWLPPLLCPWTVGWVVPDCWAGLAVWCCTLLAACPRCAAALSGRLSLVRGWATARMQGPAGSWRAAELIEARTINQRRYLVFE